MQTYFENDFITIGYDKVNHVIMHKWIVAPTSPEFREGLNYLIPAMELFNTGKIITDTICLGIIHPIDQQWLVTDWFQNVLKVGYSQLAIIIPARCFTRMSIEDTMSQVVNPVPIAYFENMEAAIAWTKQL